MSFKLGYHLKGRRFSLRDIRNIRIASYLYHVHIKSATNTQILGGFQGYKERQL